MRTRFTWSPKLIRTGEGWTVDPSADELAPRVLARADGFLVKTPSGTLGVVDRLEEDEDGSVSALIVLGGLIHTRCYRVPVNGVTALDPLAETVDVNPAAVETL